MRRIQTDDVLEMDFTNLNTVTKFHEFYTLLPGFLYLLLILYILVLYVAVVFWGFYYLPILRGRAHITR